MSPAQRWIPTDSGNKRVMKRNQTSEVSGANASERSKATNSQASIVDPEERSVRTLSEDISQSSGNSK